jgi:hypothetical protein
VSEFTGLSAAGVAASLQAQGIALAPGRAEKIAAALAPSIEKSAADARNVVTEADYLSVVQATQWRP